MNTIFSKHVPFWYSMDWTLKVLENERCIYVEQIGQTTPCLHHE